MSIDSRSPATGNEALIAALRLLALLSCVPDGGGHPGGLGECVGVTDGRACLGPVPSLTTVTSKSGFGEGRRWAGSAVAA
jgi:hypothetical protein